MLRLAIDAGYPSVRQWLARDGGASALEHRELSDLLSIEPVGGERIDWHFARLSVLFVNLFTKRDSSVEYTLSDFLLEHLILPPTDADADDADDESRERFIAAIAARTGGTMQHVRLESAEPTADDPEG